MDFYCKVCKYEQDGGKHICSICGKKCCWGCISKETLDTDKEVCDECHKVILNKPTKALI
jgi:hypothetical protein